MKPTAGPRVKVCCIQSVEEGALAVRYGAAAVGLVSAMPSGPGPISEDLIASIVPTIPPGVDTFLLTCKQRPEEVIDQQHRTKVNTIQLVDRFPVDGYPLLRRALPGIRIVQVIHVRGEEAFAEASAVAGYVDAILLDSGNPSLGIKELGGTGRVHNWAVSRKIRETVDVPVFLAGGLTAENVQNAIREVGPFGVDVCGGVRTSGALDEEKLAAFFAAML